MVPYYVFCATYANKHPEHWCWSLSWQCCECRLKLMSDADLMTVLEQVNQGRFQLPAAAPSLSNAQPSSDTLSGAGPASRGTSNSSDSPVLRPLIERQSPSIFPHLGSATQDDQQGDQHLLPTAASPTGKQEAPQPDAAAAKSAPHAWQQQTDRLQAFAKPLMQRLQGNPCFSCTNPLGHLQALSRCSTVCLAVVLTTFRQHFGHRFTKTRFHCSILSTLCARKCRCGFTTGEPVRCRQHAVISSDSD